MKKVKFKNLYILFLSSAVLISDKIYPCSVCVGGFTQEKIDAYFYTTIVLTTIPFVIIGLFFFLIKFYKKKNMEN